MAYSFNIKSGDFAVAVIVLTQSQETLCSVEIITAMNLCKLVQFVSEIFKAKPFTHLFSVNLYSPKWLYFELFSDK